MKPEQTSYSLVFPFLWPYLRSRFSILTAEIAQFQLLCRLENLAHPVCPTKCYHPLYRQISELIASFPLSFPWKRESRRFILDPRLRGDAQKLVPCHDRGS